MRPFPMMSGAPAIPAPLVDYDFAGGAALDARFTFTRASTAGYFDSDGTWKTVANDVIRTVAGQGLLIEGSCTNYLKWSRDFTATGDWVRTNATAALNQTGIDGAANSASSLTATADNATVLRPYTSGYSTWCFSVYLKRISGTGAISITHDGGTTWTECTLTTSWQRFWVYRSGTNPSVGIKIAVSGDVVAVDGAQNEVLGTAKISSPTSVVFTAGAYVSRAADVLTMTPAGWMDFVQGMLFIKYIQQPVGAGYPQILALSDGGIANAINIGNWQYVSGTIAADVKVGGVTQGSSTSAGYAVPIGTEVRTAFAWRTGEMVHAVNGVVHPTYGIRTLASLPAMTQILWGCRGDSTYRGACIIGRFAYWPVPPRADKLRSLTA